MLHCEEVCSQKELYGLVAEHYNKIGSYIAELERADPNINVVLVTDYGDGVPRGPNVFKRMYVSFPSLREGVL